MLKEGDKVPSFEVQDSNGNTITQDDIKGKKTVFYFYPKDDTPGCTKEGQAFSENLSKVGTQPIIGTQINFKFDKVIGLLVSIILITLLVSILVYCFGYIRTSSKVHPEQSTNSESTPVISIL